VGDPNAIWNVDRWRVSVSERDRDIPFADGFSWSEELAHRIQARIDAVGKEISGIYSDAEAELNAEELRVLRRIIGTSYLTLVSHIGLPLRDQFPSIRRDWG
jgi:hypothetical protein